MVNFVVTNDIMLLNFINMTISVLSGGSFLSLSEKAQKSSPAQRLLAPPYGVAP
jgi:hypothetical protein